MKYKIQYCISCYTKIVVLAGTQHQLRAHSASLSADVQKSKFYNIKGHLGVSDYMKV